MTVSDREFGEMKTELKFMSSEVAEIKRDVKALLSFQWKIFGFSACAAFLATIVMQFVGVGK